MTMTLVASPVLRMTSGPGAGNTYDLRGPLRIGRHPHNEVSLRDLSVSRYHCWVKFEDGHATVEDLASANGTWLNEARIQTPTPLRDGDVVRAGATTFVFTEAA